MLRVQNVLYGRLKAGQSVTLGDGAVVHPQQVLGPEEASLYCVILPRISYNQSNLNLHRISVSIIAANHVPILKP